MTNNTNHTANFLVSNFLSSKRSLKKMYGLRNSHISILRYICDSIDFNFLKRKKFSTKLYQSQIVKYSRNSERTVRDALIHLIKKRLIIRNKNEFTVGLVLKRSATIAGRIDTGKNCIKDRYRQPLPTSNSSNLSNKAKSYPQLKDVREVMDQSMNERSEPSLLLLEFMKKRKRTK